MINREEIIQLIFRAIDEVNQLLPPERRLQKLMRQFYPIGLKWEGWIPGHGQFHYCSRASH